MFEAIQFLPFDLTFVGLTACLLILGTPVPAWRRRRNPVFWFVFVVPALFFGLINSVCYGVDEYWSWGFPCRYAHVNVTAQPQLSADASYTLSEERSFSLLALLFNAAIGLAWSYVFALFCCNQLRTEPLAPAAGSRQL